MPGTDASPRVLDTFLEAVRIDSPSGEEGVFGRWCAERLEDLGCAVRFDDSARETGSDCGNLIAELPGTAGGLEVVLSAHLDTVEPGRGIEPVVVDGVVRSAGATILGADDKAGVAAILEALQRLRDSGAPHAPVRVLLTTGEEVGLRGAKALASEDCRGDVCLVLDAHGEVGGVITAAPTHYTFDATFRGVSAHAGVEPEKGVSAIAMAAAAIARMELGRLDAETTANVGSICGGTATNVVAGSCTLTGECRSLDPERVESVRAAMDAALVGAADAAGGSVEVAWTLEYSGFSIAEDDPATAPLRRAADELGITLAFFPTGGGSDANVLATRGLPSLVLGCGMDDVHGTDESVAVRDLEALSDLMEAVLRGAVA